jgi:hypothetical protein
VFWRERWSGTARLTQAASYAKVARAPGLWPVGSTGKFNQFATAETQPRIRVG